jgi:hypothetical protein
MLRQMTGEETKTYHRNKSYQISKKLRKLDQYDDFDYPSIEQRKWVIRRLKRSNTWPKVHENKIADKKHWK